MDLEGKIFTGVNVENGSYGLTICAERNSIFAGVTNKFSGIDLMVILSNAKEVISPCGACRQVISEFTKDCPIVVFSQDKRYDYTLKELLPQGFSLN